MTTTFSDLIAGGAESKDVYNIHWPVVSHNKETKKHSVDSWNPSCYYSIQKSLGLASFVATLRQWKGGVAKRSAVPHDGILQAQWHMLHLYCFVAKNCRDSSSPSLNCSKCSMLRACNSKFFSQSLSCSLDGRIFKRTRT